LVFEFSRNFNDFFVLFFHGIQTVGQQIDEHLFDFRPVNRHIERFVEFGLQMNTR
jgi:hypothetical protein